MKLSRAVTGLVLAGAALVASAAPALAHADLTGSTPAEGAALATPPATVQLTFGEPVSAVAGGIEITGPGGTKWAVGKATVVDKTVSVPVTADSGPAGAYTLTWKVTSDDGDAVSGKIGFTLTAAVSSAAPTTSAAPPSTPVSTAAAAPAADTGGGGIPGWVWIIVAVVVLAGAVGVLVWGRRGKDS